MTNRETCDFIFKTIMTAIDVLDSDPDNEAYAMFGGFMRQFSTLFSVALVEEIARDDQMKQMANMN